jgi:hypothetical protein
MLFRDKKKYKLLNINILHYVYFIGKTKKKFIKTGYTDQKEI